MQRGSAYATLDGRQVRLLYLANAYVPLARAFVRACAGAARGDARGGAAELAREASTHRGGALAHLALPLVAIGCGAAFAWLLA